MMIRLLTYWALYVFYAALVFHNSYVLIVLYDLPFIDSGDKKKSFSVWLSKTHLVEDCLLAAVCGKFSQMKSLSAVSSYSRPTQNPSELYEHKAVMNLSPPVILSWAAGSLSSQSHTVTTSCAQPGFPFCSLSLKTKRVVSMLSENYSAQDVSPSYLPMLKATFLPKSAPFG